MARPSKVTFEVPPDLRALMDEHSEVNWSEVLRAAIRRHARVMAIARQIEEEQNDPRVQDVAAMLKRGMGERFRKAVDARRR